MNIFIALIEHKSSVDYNVSMQILRYMVYIWDDYERREVQDFVSQIKERHMSDLFANFKATVNVQEERRIGREQGLGIGEEIKLIKLVCGKIGLGQSIEQIAIDLLEDEEHIKRISQIASKYAPDYNADKIYEELYNFDQKRKSEFIKVQ